MKDQIEKSREILSNIHKEYKNILPDDIIIKSRNWWIDWHTTQQKALLESVKKEIENLEESISDYTDAEFRANFTSEFRLKLDKLIK